jgi:hypothetical protein
MKFEATQGKAYLTLDLEEMEFSGIASRIFTSSTYTERLQVFSMHMSEIQSPALTEEIQWGYHYHFTPQGPL